MDFSLTCMLCGITARDVPRSLRGVQLGALPAMHEHLIKQHAITRDQLAQQSKRIQWDADGAPVYVFAGPDGQDWLRARLAPRFGPGQAVTVQGGVHVGQHGVVERLVVTPTAAGYELRIAGQSTGLIGEGHLLPVLGSLAAEPLPAWPR